MSALNVEKSFLSNELEHQSRNDTIMKTSVFREWIGKITQLREPLHNLVHCEERSDAAIHKMLISLMQWIVSRRVTLAVAMTRFEVKKAKAHVFDYIEVDYNRTRLHSTLGYLNPEQFELTHVA